MGREVRPSRSEGETSGNLMIWENGSSAARTKSGLNGEVAEESNADSEKFVGTRPSKMIGAFEAVDGPKREIGLAVDKRKVEKSETSGSLEVSIVEKSGRRDWFAMRTMVRGLYPFGRLGFLPRLRGYTDTSA